MESRNSGLDYAGGFLQSKHTEPQQETGSGRGLYIEIALHLHWAA